MRNTGKTVVINYDTLCVQFKRGCDIDSDSKNLKEKYIEKSARLN